MDIDGWDESPSYVEPSSATNTWGESNSFSNRGDRGSRRGRGRRPFSNRGGDFSRHDGGCRGGGSHMKTLTIPKSMIGRLIGRGGSRKRELEDQSGVSLHITDSDGEGLVEIRGPSEEACSKAEETISNITRDGDRHAGRNRGGRESRGAYRGFGDFQNGGFSNHGDDESAKLSDRRFNNSGGFGNSSGGFGNSSGGFGNSSGGFGNSSGGFGNNSGGFGNNSGSRYSSDSGGFGNNSGGLSSGIGGFGSNSGGFGNNSGRYRSDSDGFGNNSGGFSSGSGGFSSGSGGFGSNSGGFGSHGEGEGRPPGKGFIDWGAVAKADPSTSGKWDGCPEMLKDFYLEHPDVSCMTDGEAELLRKENKILFVEDLSEGENKRKIPNPCVTFEHAFDHHPLILNEIYKQKFTTPSPIQTQMWPVLLQGIDCIGIAQTGTGKTLGFLLPALIHIDNQPIPLDQRGGANVLILSPTRELALQIHEEVGKYNYKNIKSCCVYGGGSRKEQVNTVEKGVQIIIATPGRLNDLINSDVINILSITYLVLDEADRMLDLGFEPQIMKILLDIRPDRQTVMTSATWPDGVQRLATRYMKNPIHVSCVLDLAACHSVTQYVEYIDEEYKRDRLYEFITQEINPKEKCLIFVGRKALVDDISSDFALRGIEAQSIHGGREQIDRETSLAEFKNGDVNILIATDVASRGLDISDISYVFNLDMPRNIEEYVHRVGRTGRAGRSGTAVTLVCRKDWAIASQLIDILTEANQEVPMELHDMAERFKSMKEREEREGGPRRGRGGRGRGRRGRRGDGDDFGFGFSFV